MAIQGSLEFKLFSRRETLLNYPEHFSVFLLVEKTDVPIHSGKEQK